MDLPSWPDPSRLAPAPHCSWPTAIRVLWTIPVRVCIIPVSLYIDVTTNVTTLLIPFDTKQLHTLPLIIRFIVVLQSTILLECAPWIPKSSPFTNTSTAWMGLIPRTWLVSVPSVQLSFRKINRTRKLSSENTDPQIVSNFADLAGTYEMKANSIAIMMKGMLMPNDDQLEIWVRHAGVKARISGTYN